MLLRPSRRLNELVLGVLARAARCYQMDVCAFVFRSNHCHLLLRPTSATQLARFMNYLNSNIAREAGRLHRWRPGDKARVWPSCQKTARLLSGAVVIWRQTGYK